MLNVIYCEFLKIKKSKLLYASILSAIIMTAFMNIVIFVANQTGRTFESYSINIELANTSLIFIIMFTIVSSYIFIREYDDKTENIIYAYAIKRKNIFIAKLIVIYFLIFITYAVQCISIYLGYYLAYRIFDWDLICTDIKANFYACIFQFAIVMIPVFLANLKKNIILPIMFSVLSICICGMGDSIEFIKYIPVTFPKIILDYIKYGTYTDINMMNVISIICFVVFFVLSLVVINKKDIK